MKRTLLISYDLGVPEDSADYDRVFEYVKSLGSWAKPLQSLWFVVTTVSPSEARSILKNLTDASDKILVLDVSNDYWATARISEKVTTWMKTNL